MIPPQQTEPPKFSALRRPRLLLGARTPPRDWAGKPLGSPAKGADFGDRARRSRSSHKKGSVMPAEVRGLHPRARPACRPPGEEETSPAPTFRREEAAPPAVPAVATAAAAPHAQRQQERHQAQPPRQHPRRPSRHRAAAAAAAYRPHRPRLPVSAGARRGPPRCRCWVRYCRRRRRPHPRPPLPSAAPLARSLARRQQQHSLARTRSGSGAHPGTARDVTEGGRWLVHIHETRTLARGCELPRLAAPGPQLSTAIPNAAHSRDPLCQALAP